MDAVDARLAIIKDKTSTPNEKLTAMQQLEDRALGRPVTPTEDVTVREPADIEAFKAMPTNEKIAYLQQRRAEKAASDARLGGV